MTTELAPAIFRQLRAAIETIQSHGAPRCVWLPVSLLVLDDAVRATCENGRCNGYQRNYMCPPFIGDFETIRERLSWFDSGVLIQKSYPLSDKRDFDAIVHTQRDFHAFVHDAEKFLAAAGIKNHWGMIGGQCVLCVPCKAESGAPCAYPDKARNSLESIGVRVLALARKLHMDAEFHDDKIVWTGCVLWCQHDG